jgi:hypothetical protein
MERLSQPLDQPEVRWNHLISEKLIHTNDEEYSTVSRPRDTPGQAPASTLVLHHPAIDCRKAASGFSGNH